MTKLLLFFASLVCPRNTWIITQIAFSVFFCNNEINFQFRTFLLIVCKLNNFGLNCIFVFCRHIFLFDKVMLMCKAKVRLEASCSTLAYAFICLTVVFVQVSAFIVVSIWWAADVICLCIISEFVVSYIYGGGSVVNWVGRNFHAELFMPRNQGV